MTDFGKAASAQGSGMGLAHGVDHIADNTLRCTRIAPTLPPLQREGAGLPAIGSLGTCPEFSFPDQPALHKRLKRQNQAHLLAAQTGHCRPGFKRREIVLIWRPPGPQSPSFLSFHHRGES